MNALPNKQEALVLFVYVFIFFIKFMQDLEEGTIQVLFFYKHLACLWNF